MMRFAGILTLVLALALIAPAMGQGQPLRIVASFSILSDVVQNIVRNAGEVTSIVPVGADPHSFEPSAQDFAAVAEADLVFVAGAGFEESLLDSIAGIGSDVALVEASTCVPMRAYGGEHDDEHQEAGEDSDAAVGHTDALGLDLASLCEGYDTYIAGIDELKAEMGFPSHRISGGETLVPLYAADCGAHEDNEDESGGHDEHACDPHVWSDPRSVYYWILYIRDALSAADPANADQYHANAEEYLYLLDDLLRLELEPLLAEIPDERRLLLTNHETLGYFAAAYGFETVGVVLPGGSVMAEPSARDLASLIELVRARRVTAIFSEASVSSRVSEQIASETGAGIYLLYSDSLSEPGGSASDYLSYVTHNFATIAAALAP